MKALPFHNYVAGGNNGREHILWYFLRLILIVLNMVIEKVVRRCDVDR